MTFDTVQFEKLLAAINALHARGWGEWVPVVSVFVSALLAMVVGILLEVFKTNRERRRRILENVKKEISQINVLITGVGYNIEILFSMVIQHIFPHYNESHAAFSALDDAIKNPDNLARLLKSMPQYPALVTTCPDVYFVQFDLSKELPFIVEKDPELLMRGSWLISQIRELSAAIKNRNDNIINSAHATAQQGGLSTSQLHSALHLQKTIADTECLVAGQLFELLFDIGKRLEAINDSYQVKAKRSKLTIVSKELDAVISELKAKTVQSHTS